MTPFPEIKKKLGFGCMRLPMLDGDVDIEQTCRMVDAFLDAGFNYFDTAHGYIDGKSETAIRECLTSRHPRESYLLTDKLSSGHFKTESDIRPLFQSKLDACGVDYFDFYLMHAQGKVNYDHYLECRAYETAFALKVEGKVRHVGISFHDKAEFLERILNDYPQIEVVQLQLNYVDWDDMSVQGRQCYEVCRKHGKPVLVMEPVKGGNLVKLPDDAQKVYDALNAAHGTANSNASYAIRFAAGLEGVVSVLSGMSDMAQMEDNIRTMRDFTPLTQAEQDAVTRVAGILTGKPLIPCTACRYCTEVCPIGIPIPEFFACMNARKVFNDWNQKFYYQDVLTVDSPKASDCLKCGACEDACPQHLEIRSLLENVAAEFE